MNSLLQVLRGFLFGVGFTSASVLIVFAYTAHLYADSEFAYKERLRQLYLDNSSDIAEMIAPEVLGYKLVEGRVVITSRVAESMVGQFGYYLKFLLRSKSGDVSICRQPIDPEYGNEGIAHFETSCRPLVFSARDLDTVSVSVGLGDA